MTIHDSRDNVSYKLEIFSNELSNKDLTTDEHFSLLQRIEEFVNNSPASLKFSPSDSEAHYSFKPLLAKIIANLSKLGSSPDISDTIQKLSQLVVATAITNSESVQPEILKKLPAKNKEQTQESLNLLQHFLSKNIEGAEESIASWIQHQTLSLNSLDFSLDEIERIAPYLTYVKLEGSINTEELVALLTLCKQVETLILTSDSINSLPELPQTIEKLVVKNCDILESITTLHEGLTSFNHSHCSQLRLLPEKLPSTIKSYTSSNCPMLINLPTLNEGLTELICIDNPQITLPEALNDSLQKFWCLGSLGESLPKLPDSLEFLDASANDHLSSFPSQYPEKLKKCWLNDCPNLTSIPEKRPVGLKISLNGHKI
jgi:hypothetical protein